MKKEISIFNALLESCEERPELYETEFNSIPIVIEIKSGEIDKKTNDDGSIYERLFHSDYGFISGIPGADGETLDCFVNENPNPEANVYVVHQRFKNEGDFDEDKVMLGFDNKKDAVEMWSKHDKCSKNYGGATEFTPEEFKSIIDRVDNEYRYILTNKDHYNLLADSNIIDTNDTAFIIPKV